MITWLHPAAFAAAAAVALPLIVHLLLRRRASRVVVPSVRFLLSTEESAVRVRRPSDLLLLLLRMAIVTCAALALAAPLVITASRRAAWDGRRIVAIAIDRSSSVESSAATEAAAAESGAATASRMFEDVDVGSATQRAAAWLRRSPPGRQELVIISDFQEGSMTAADLGVVPEVAGVRAVRVPTRPSTGASIDGGAIMYGARTYAQSISLDGAATSFRLRELVTPPGGGPALPDSVLRTVTSIGIFVPAKNEPLLPAPAADSLETALDAYRILSTRPDEPRLRELEPQHIAASTLAQWMRDAKGADVEAWRRSDDSDGRWLWVAVLLLIGAETLVRRERARSAAAEAHAA